MSVSQQPQQPLNIRNNNPGNLRFVGQPGATKGEGGFAKFETPQAGLDAMRAQIELDTQKRGLNLSEFINKYAPPSENKTSNYIDFVAKKTGLGPSDKVPASLIQQLQTAMIEMEGGPKSLSYFQSVMQPTQVAQVKPTTTVPARAQEPRPTDQVPKEKQPAVQVAAAIPKTDLPSSYTAALALNYLADTDPEGVTMSKVNEMLAEMMEDGGGGSSRTGGGKVLQQYAQSKSVDPFQFVLQPEEEPKAQPRRAVPKMPKMFADGGVVAKAANLQTAKLKAADKDWLAAREKEFEGYNAEVAKYNEALAAYQKEVDAYNESIKPYQAEYDAYGQAVNEHNAKVDAYNKLLGSYVVDQQGNLITARAPSQFRPYYTLVDQVNQLNESRLPVNLDESAWYYENPSRVFRYGTVPEKYEFVPTGGEQGYFRFRGVTDPYESFTQRTAPTEFTMKPPGNPPPEFTYQEPTAPTGLQYTPEQVEQYQRDAIAKAQKAAQNRATALQVITGQGPYANLGLSLSPTQPVNTRLFADGGMVSNEVPQVDAQGRVIRETPTPEPQFSLGERAVGAGEAALSALSGLTAPASILYDVARGVPREQISPGNFMYAPRTEAGQAMAQDLGRFMQESKLDAALPQVQLQRPYPVGAAARQGIGALERGAEAAGTSAVRAITGKPDITPEQIYGAMADPKGILSLGATAASRPGGTFLYNDDVSPDLARMIEANPDQTTRSAQEAFLPKISQYVQSQYGAPNDPLFKAALEGRFKPIPFYSPNKLLDDFAKPIAEVTGIPLDEGKKLNLTHVDKLFELSKKGDQEAQKIVAYGVDRSLMTTGKFTQEQTAEALKDADQFNKIAGRLESIFDMAGINGSFGRKENIPIMMRDYVRQKGEPKTDAQKLAFKDIEYKYATELELDARLKREAQTTDPLQRAYPLSLSPLYQYERQAFETSLTNPMKEELARGKPVYQKQNVYGRPFDTADIFEYMSENDPAKWSKMSAPELIIASSAKNLAAVTSPTRIARMADDGLPLTQAQKLVGTQKFLPVESPTLGKGAEWREITDRNGLRIEGGIMEHCLKRDSSGYCNRLMDKEAKYFTLRDADGQPYVSIEIAKPIGKEKENVPFSVIRQVKGHRNDNPMPLYGEEISTFLNEWQNKMGVKLTSAERAENVPSQFRPGNFGMEAPPENFRKGGMVDKPLYDRAA